ncbi:hypothetical protein HELRODRAFT_159538 [Helobdella robusta]|uniref:Uncharacterized protein n=1 Tax=Helobdella robusta TaxID=6412 RepID=T1EP52_HELRO|nr:hypothetical protein HELRODRAFT_159538 [Helobdella robusta]ESO12946.1 hypothetical protein HELRODRAFT_159538 [Helobdella robusta]
MDQLQIRHSNMKSIVSMVKQTTEDLARMSVYWDKAEFGELYREPGKSFGAHFREISLNPECGLYLVLCRLHCILGSFRERPYSKKGIAEIRAISQKEGMVSRSIRYWRDFLIMRDMHKLLIRINQDMLTAVDNMKKRHKPRFLQQTQ